MAGSGQLANSIEGQVDQLKQGFDAVKKAARTFEAHQTKSTTLLYTVLESVYTFGEALLAQKSSPGTSVVREFIIAQGKSYNKRVVANPYITLVQLAFTNRGDSSLSQYSTVLRYANSKKVLPGDFLTWLGGDIEGRRDKALEDLNSTQRRHNNQGRTSRLERATNALLARPHSIAVSLPAGVEAQEGFALVLARIDGSNNAQIIEVIEGDQSSLEPTILRFDGDKSPPMAGITDRPLGNLFRALDFIVGITPSKGRDIVVRNFMDGERAVCRVEAVSQSYSAPGVRVVLNGHIEALGDQAWLLHARDAETIRAEFVRHDDWQVDDQGAITADKLAQALHLVPLEDSGKYRVAVTTPNAQRGLMMAQAEQAALRAFMASQRATHAAIVKNHKRKSTFSTLATLDGRDNRLFLSLPKMVGGCEIGSLTSDHDIEDRQLLLRDIEALVATVQPYEVDLHGWVVDTDVDDAGLGFQIDLDDDRVTIVLPTTTGGNYNQVCEPLAL